MKDLKAVYGAVYEQSALDALDAFSEKRDKNYPKISKVLAWEQGKSKHIFQIFGKGSQTYLHDKCNQRLQQSAQESDQGKVGIPAR